MSQELIVKDTGVIARAELDTQISTAKAYPRNAKRAVEYATELATMDEATAQSCFYVLPRKEKDGSKKEIKGGSIRLAEIMANAWGNIHAATRIVENDGRHITAEGIAWDLETNVKISMQNKVSIRFGEKDGKGGYTANADMQTVLSNAASAKALRNAIFKVIPKALVDMVREKAMNFSVGDQKTKTAKVNEIFDKLVKMGLDKQKIMNYYGHASLSEFTTEDLRSLLGVGTAIKEGVIKVDEVFEIEKSEDNSKRAAERISDLITSKKEQEVVIPTDSRDFSGFTEEAHKIRKSILNAKSHDTLDVAADLISSLNEGEQEELTALYKKRKSELK